jgi:hypothetical protein
MPLSPERVSAIDWSQFQLQDHDLEVVTNLLLEREVPLTTSEMALAIIERRQTAEAEIEAQAAEAGARPYRPAEHHPTGTRLTFPALDNRVGVVVGERRGFNPDLGEFDVIEVRFGEDGERREFASSLADHRLNKVAEMPATREVDGGAEGVLRRHGREIEQALERRLEGSDGIVRIAGRWFPQALLAEINVGHLNLAEAVLDVNSGGPLPTPELLQHVELPESFDPALAQFSLDYALQQDERFDEVGPAGKVLWYLRRLEPPEVLSTPAPLLPGRTVEAPADLTDELRALELELDDELTGLTPPAEPEEEVVLPLIFPHWWAGTLPLSSRLSTLFPTAYEAPRIRFILVDGHSGEKFPGWVVRQPRYVYGLGDWYRRYEVPAGGLVRVRRGPSPGEVVVEAAERRRRNEWIRTVVLHAGGAIGFTMLRQPVGTSYDERMVVGLGDREAFAAVWQAARQRREPFERVVRSVFLELGKLNPQAAVHAQSLYSGVNVLVRSSPAAVFSRLVRETFFEYVGDLYWRRAEGQRDVDA